MSNHIETVRFAEHTAQKPNSPESTRILGAFSLRSSHAEVISNNRDGDYAFFYGPGWHTDGRVIAANFDKYVSHLGSTHYGVHSDGEYVIDDQKDEWIKARKADGFRPALIYAQSKGAMTVSHMFSDKVFRDEFGEIESICFDSGVANKHVVKLMQRTLMSVGVRLPDHPTVERLCSALMEWMSPDECPHDHGSEVACDEALDNSTASARTRLLACVTQLQYLWSHDIAQMDLTGLGADVRNKVFISSTNDAIVNNDVSVSIIDNAYGGGFEHWIDTARKPNSHAAGTEHPRSVIDALTRQNTKRYPKRNIASPLGAIAITR